ncbi:hypothetical protein CEP82_000195 [Mobiluncus mulieris]|nr:hypothetical protein CEP82_000195 [Mobiluncus mulieris]
MPFKTYGYKYGKKTRLRSIPARLVFTPALITKSNHLILLRLTILIIHVFYQSPQADKPVSIGIWLVMKHAATAVAFAHIERLWNPQFPYQRLDTSPVSVFRRSANKP